MNDVEIDGVVDFIGVWCGDFWWVCVSVDELF